MRVTGCGRPSGPGRVADLVGQVVGRDRPRHLAGGAVDVLDGAGMRGERVGHLAGTGTGFAAGAGAAGGGGFLCWTNSFRILQRFGISALTSASSGVP